MTFNEQFNEWLTRLSVAEHPAAEIVAFNFGMFETAEGFTIYLVGTKQFDAEDDSWALEPDFEPQEKYLEIDPAETEGLEWDEVLDMALATIRTFIKTDEFQKSIVGNAQVITAGFDDGDLTRIK